MSRSADLYRRALSLLPGGVNSPVRAMRAIGRDPIFIESGSGALIRDVDGIVDFAKELTVRYSEGIESVEGDAAAALQAQAPKRVAIHFHPKRVATWDHRKLGGVY